MHLAGLAGGTAQEQPQQHWNAVRRPHGSVITRSPISVGLLLSLVLAAMGKIGSVYAVVVAYGVFPYKKLPNIRRASIAICAFLRNSNSRVNFLIFSGNGL